MNLAVYGTTYASSLCCMHYWFLNLDITLCANIPHFSVAKPAELAGYLILRRLGFHNLLGVR